MALKVPLLFLFPGMTPQVVLNPVELVDIFPTLVDLAGLPNNIIKCKIMDKSPLCFDGKSLVPLMRVRQKCNATTEHTYNTAISQYPRPTVNPTVKSDKPRLKDINIMGYTIRTKRFRYTEWISFNNTLFTRNWKKKYGIELYDHLIDPDESRNFYLVSKYKKCIKHLSTILRSHVERNV